VTYFSKSISTLRVVGVIILIVILTIIIVIPATLRLLPRACL
jgi:hypothetical protein